MNTRTEPEATGGELDLSAARHGAAHAIAHLHFGVTFGSVGLSPSGWCEVIDPGWAANAQTNARIALAGPCMDLAVDLIEDEGDEPIVVPWLESWRDDVVNQGDGYRDDMVAARGGVANEAAWALAFCRTNFDLIDEAAMLLVAAATNVEYLTFAAQLDGRTLAVGPDELEAAYDDFAGGLLALDVIDEAVIEHLASELVK